MMMGVRGTTNHHSATTLGTCHERAENILRHELVFTKVWTDCVPLLLVRNLPVTSSLSEYVRRLEADPADISSDL